mmetsp:Transcript_48337/g.112054  ORF Transcript_48337/g.112054 Transcript_48337/m.112054 type:complete len:560 (-) Transcript_48337:130-1809(-)
MAAVLVRTALVLALALAADIPLYEVFEVRLLAAKSHAQPFAVWCHALVTGPPRSRHAHMVLMMFYDGNDEWAFRFAPDAEGMWNWTTSCFADPGLDTKEGYVQCRGSKGSPGGILVDPDHPRHLIYENGWHYLPIGLEMDWFHAVGERGINATGQLVRALADHGINHVVAQVYANYSEWSTLPMRQSPRLSPTVLTPWASDDQLTLELNYFRSLDSSLALLSELSIIAHLMIYVGNKHVRWPERGSLADEVYWRYCLARFGAFSAVLWDVSKEAASYNVPKTYIMDRLELIHKMNAHKRIVTSHSGLDWSNSCVEWDHKGDDPCNILSVQVHWGDKTFVDQQGRYYEDMLHRVQANPHRPVLNVEFLYEAGPTMHCAGSCCGGCASTDEHMALARRAFWDMYMAGSSGVWYNTDLSWDVISEPVASTARGLKFANNLRQFWSSLPFWLYEPDHGCIEHRVPWYADIRCLSATDTALDRREAKLLVVHVRSADAKFSLRRSLVRGRNVTGYWWDPSAAFPVKVPALGVGSTSHLRKPSHFAEESVLSLRLERLGTHTEFV